MTILSVKSNAYILVKRLMNEHRIPAASTVEQTLVTKHSLNVLKEKLKGEKVEFLYSDQSYLITRALFKNQSYPFILLINHGESRSLTLITAKR